MLCDSRNDDGARGDVDLQRRVDRHRDRVQPGHRGEVAPPPIYVGLASGLVMFVVDSLATKPTDPQVLAEWDCRSRGQDTETVPSPVS
jgi:hypothetical protein